MDGIGNSFRQATRQYGVLLISIFVTILGTILLVRLFSRSNSLAALALAGIVILLAALLVFTSLMSVAGLSDKTQALGLPDGSVRAIIAISLVGMFAILAASVLQPQPLHEVSRVGLSEADVRTFQINNPGVKDLVIQITSSPDASSKTYNLSFLSSSTQALDEFGKQMLTLLGTLMTALTAFYFGGRTASSTTGTDVSRVAPDLTGIEDGTTIKNGTTAPISGPLALTFTGTNLNSIRTARLVANAPDHIEIEAVSVLSSPNRATCVFPAREEFGNVGVWDITVTDDTGRTSTKKGLLTFSTASTDEKASTPQKPSLKSVSPPSAPVTQAEFFITGTGLKETKAVSLKTDDTDWLQATIVGDNTDAKVSFKPPLPPEFKAGKWTVQVLVGASEPIELEQKLEIT